MPAPTRRIKERAVSEMTSMLRDAAARRVLTSAAARFTNGLVQIATQQLTRGKQPEEQSRKSSDCDGESKNPAVQPRVAQARQLHRLERDEQTQSAISEHHARETSDECEEHGFREQLA